MNNNTDLLLIFTRNPELGKCKTRLASKVGDEAALNIYKFLLQHTSFITQKLPVNKRVYYSEEIWVNDIWNNLYFDKKLQKGEDLGERMKNAFVDGFKEGFERIIIIGSDMYDLSQIDLEDAFDRLKKYEYVIGPALDGGYYLLGMKKLKPELFESKDWGQKSVLDATINDLIGENYTLLTTKNDIDHYEDIAHIDTFQPFLNHIQK